MIFAYHSPAHLFHGYESSLEIASKSTMHLEYQILLGYLHLVSVYSEIQHDGFHRMENMLAVNILVQCCQHIFTMDGGILSKIAG
jgi:hypothetical protein